MKKSIAILAMCATALSPVLSTAAYADTIPAVMADAADAATQGAMDDQCDALADGYDTGNGDIWAGQVVLGAVTQIAGPAEVDGTRDIIESTIMHAGTYVPSTLEIRGDPYRNGGSVNMFGDQWSTAGFWTDSTYDFTADFDSTFSHAFSCTITQSVFHAATVIHHPAEGAYVIAGDFGNSEEATRGNCAAFTAQGFPLATRPAWWGVDLTRGGNPNNPHCVFQGTQAFDQDVPESYDPPAEIAVIAGVPVTQDQTDMLTAFEDHGGPVQVTGEFFVGKTVICISPGPKGGSWRVQNGYAGALCTTTWFKVAPTPQGSTTSQGTYTSVPNYTF